MSNKIKRSRRHQTRHRSSGPNFIQLFRYMLDSPAYVSLSTAARAALVEVIRGYNGANNGKIVLSERDLATRMGCHRETCRYALQELVDKGFIEPRIKGAFRIKYRRATEWRLNDRRCDATGQEQSQAFMKWTGDPTKNSDHRTENPSRTGRKIRPLGNFCESPPQDGKSVHYRKFHGTEIPSTSISTREER